MISLTLPYPVSANQYWRSFIPRGAKTPVTTLSAKAKAYKAEVGNIFLLSSVKGRIRGRVELKLTLHPPEPKDAAKRRQKHPLIWEQSVRCIDLDNALKVTIDALKGIAFEDDKNIFRIIAERREPRGDGSVEIEVRAM